MLSCEAKYPTKCFKTVMLFTVGCVEYVDRCLTMCWQCGKSLAKYKSIPTHVLNAFAAAGETSLVVST